MLYFVSGPVNMEFADGILDNWHLEAYNNSDSVVPVTLKLFDINGVSTIYIGSTSRDVNPHSHEYMSLSTNGVHHTIAQVEYPQGYGDILLTLYGRDRNGRALPGAIFFNHQLIELQNEIKA